MTTLKTISLWQPFATLMASGAKRIETRDWQPQSLRVGQLVAIHAAKHWTADERDLCHEDLFFRRYLSLAERRGLWSGQYPPLGGVVAIARFLGAFPTERLVNHITATEYAFGNYAPGRYGWVFSEVRPLAIIPARGQQGLFDWEPPRADELRALYIEQVHQPRGSGRMAELLDELTEELMYTGMRRAAAQEPTQQPTTTPEPARQTEQTPPHPTRVVHCRKEAFDVYVGRQMSRYPELRATGWGNPYTARNLPPRCANAVEAYRAWIATQPRLLARLPELRGKRLGCWCAPVGGLPGNLDGHVCHGEVLAALADGVPMTPTVMWTPGERRRSSYVESSEVTRLLR